MKHSLTHSHADTPDNKRNHLLTCSQWSRTWVRGLYETSKRNAIISKCSQQCGFVSKFTYEQGYMSICHYEFTQRGRHTHSPTHPLTSIILEWMLIQSHCFFDLIQTGLLNRLHLHTQILAVPLILSVAQSCRRQGSIIHTLARWIILQGESNTSHLGNHKMIHIAR